MAGLMGLSERHLRKLTRDGWIDQKSNRRYDAFVALAQYHLYIATEEQRCQLRGY